MVIDDLSCLVLIDTNKTNKVQGGLFASVQVNTYASYNFSAASADANAVGQVTQTSVTTRTNLYQGTALGYSTAYARGSAYASSGRDTYRVSATEIKSYGW